MKYFAVIAFLALTLPAFAQDYKTLLDLPEGSTLVNLSATEREVVEEDLLVANLRYEYQGDAPRAVQNEINKVMQKALDKSKAYQSVKASTLQYNIYQYDVNQGKRNLAPNMVWKGEQGLMVKGKKQDEILKLVGELQDLGLSMSGLDYQVSPELLEETRDAMLERALEKLTKKAERAAKAIGKAKSEMKTINIDTGGGYYPQPKYARMDMAMSESVQNMAPPVAAAGESEITLTVNAQALLR